MVESYLLDSSRLHAVGSGAASTGGPSAPAPASSSAGPWSSYKYRQSAAPKMSGTTSAAATPASQQLSPGAGPAHGSPTAAPEHTVRRQRSRHFDAFREPPSPQFAGGFATHHVGGSATSLLDTSSSSALPLPPPPASQSSLFPPWDRPGSLAGTASAMGTSPNLGGSNAAMYPHSPSIKTTSGSPVSLASSLHNEDGGDDLIPTAIVIKNIPFAIKKEQLLEVMAQLGLPQPYAFNYHFDNGVFRGLAFANFTTPDDTDRVIAQLNGREIGGRKLRVEYKKMLPLAERERIEREKRERRGQLEEQHRPHTLTAQRSVSHSSLPPFIPHLPPTAPSYVHPPHHHYGPKVDLNDPDTLHIYSELLLFRDDRHRPDLTFAGPLSIDLRETITSLCMQLGLLVGFDKHAGSCLITRPPPHMLHQYSPSLGPSAPEYTYGNNGHSLRPARSFADFRATPGPNPAAYPSNPGTPIPALYPPTHTPPPQAGSGAPLRQFHYFPPNQNHSQGPQVQQPSQQGPQHSASKNNMAPSFGGNPPLARVPSNQAMAKSTSPTPSANSDTNAGIIGQKALDVHTIFNDSNLC